LKFCIDTFEWGDYIDQVWDLWYSDQTGLLLVVEEEEYSLHDKKQSSVLALSHVSLCPNKDNVWLEGLRVNPDYRRRYVATQLINKMIAYGQEQGANKASAIVSKKNIASQLMMERNGFIVISRWNYYNTNNIPRRVDKAKLGSKVATLKDIDLIRNYLRHSEIFKLSGGTYVNSWKWYSLDLYSNILADLIENKKVILNGNNNSIEGIAIINRDKHWNKNNDNTFQIVYLDASNILALKDLISFVINLIHFEDTIYDRLQVYSPQITYASTVMEQTGTTTSEEFLLYNREI
jgi:GNAT superfamily N-acetyltransferase